MPTLIPWFQSRLSPIEAWRNRGAAGLPGYSHHRLEVPDLRFDFFVSALRGSGFADLGGAPFFGESAVGFTF